ncbi:acetyl-CoA hydrolase/transferase family protein [Aciditerrimonas ferrireducens]|uniref:Acetyl-CoA hydrolase/transferase family protein n=1 Tax=Aciditerrimonas ferrireducens TaxID=667306 RepID=A0ABV6C656_9ACTN
MTPARMSLEDAVGVLRPRDSVGFGLGPGIPHGFLRALSQRTDWEDLVLGGALLLDLFEVLRHPGVSFRSGFYGPVERLLVAEGRRVDHVPGGFRLFGPILARFRPRVMVVQGAPDGEDQVNLSLHVGATAAELAAAGRDPDRLLVVELNSRLPRTAGLRRAGGRWPAGWPVPADAGGPDTNLLPLALADVVVEVDEEPFVLPESEPTVTDRAIAEVVQQFVPDGATLQTGIGGVPSVVAAALAEGPGGDYGVHSEMFTDGLRRLHEAGKVSNRRKGVFDGVSVTTFALGSASLLSWLDGNDDVAFVPVEAVNDPDLIGRNRAMVSLNGALMVDLYGQVVADHLPGRQVSGVGGHEDFVAGPELRADGRAIVCLPSTVTVDGEVRSRIVARLPEGAVVSTPRHHLDVVVTEHGAAEVRGLTVRERAEALARIADPAFRDELLAEARRLR